LKGEEQLKKMKERKQIVALQMQGSD